MNFVARAFGFTAGFLLAAAHAADGLAPARVLPAPAPQARAQAHPVQTGEPREIRAQLSPRRFTTLAAEIGAKVNRLSVMEGDTFRAGQLLVQFDCAMQQAQLGKARATLMAAEKTWAANKRLLELNSIGKLELDLAEAEVLRNRAEVSSVSVTLGKCAISAPFSGRVSEQKVREQQFVQPGQPLLEIIDDSVLELEFIVPSRWLTWLRPGHVFQVSIDEIGRSYPARVQRIGARVDPVSQSIKLVATIAGVFPELVAGMSGRVAMAPPP